MKKLGWVFGLGFLALILNFMPRQLLAQEAQVEFQMLKKVNCSTCRVVLDSEEDESQEWDNEDFDQGSESIDATDSERNIWVRETGEGQMKIEGRNIHIQEIGDGQYILDVRKESLGVNGKHVWY